MTSTSTPSDDEYGTIPMARTLKPKRTPGMIKGHFPCHPFRLMLCGDSGAGKTYCLFQMLANPKIYGGFFDEITVISPTAGTDYKTAHDPTYIPLIEMGYLKKENVINPSNCENIEEMVVEYFEKLIESPPSRTAKLIVFDDCLGVQGLLRSKKFESIFTRIRHVHLSVVFTVQTFVGAGKTIRSNLTDLIFWSAQSEQIDLIEAAFGPPNMNKREFAKMVADNTRKRFSYIYKTLNVFVPNELRFRRKIGSSKKHIIDLDQYRKN